MRYIPLRLNKLNNDLCNLPKESGNVAAFESRCSYNIKGSESELLDSVIER